MTHRTRMYRIHRHLTLGFMLLISMGIVLAQAAAPAAPSGGTTLFDRLKVPAGELRSLPQLPSVGLWGVIVGQPKLGGDGRLGLTITDKGQGLVYPTRDMLTGAAGTVEFTVWVNDPAVAEDAQPRVLLDSWPDGHNTPRLSLVLTGAKLALSLTNEGNKTAIAEGAVNWGANSAHRVVVMWDAQALTLDVDNRTLAQAEKPGLPGREPLAIILGNNRDLQAPARMEISELRMSNIREPLRPVNLTELHDNISNSELTLKTSQGYARRMYPVFDLLRRLKAEEGNYCEALARKDIGDFDQALRVVQPMSDNPAHPLYESAVFLRADLLAARQNFIGADDQLQKLIANKDESTSVRAQVRRAVLHFDQGDTQGAMAIIDQIIKQFPNVKSTNQAFLLVGLQKFKTGNFGEALNALRAVGVSAAPPQQSVAIGTALEIKIADADLEVRVANTSLKVTVTAVPSGDKEEMELRPAFSRGMFIGRLPVALGATKAGDGTLQVLGRDKVQITYVDRLSGAGEVNVTRIASVELKTDAKLAILAQSAEPIYRQVLKYRERNIVDDRWELIGTLPKDAPDFFRNPDDGALRKKPWRFENAFLYNIKAGQNIFVELNEPDSDITAEVDTITLEGESGFSNRKGDKIGMTLTETGPRTGVFTGILKTTPRGTPVDGALEVDPTDQITALYNDLRPAAGTTNTRQAARLNIRADDGEVYGNLEFEYYDEVEKVKTKIYMRANRVANGTTVHVLVDDRDLDVSDAADKVQVKVRSESGTETTIGLTENGIHTGVFVGTVKLVGDPNPGAAAAEASVLKAKPGDRITVIYQDVENGYNTPKERTYAFRLNQAENAKVALQRQIIETVDPKSVKAGMPVPPPKVYWQDTETLVPGSVHKIILQDPDVLPKEWGQQYSKVKLKSSNGSEVEVGLHNYYGHLDKDTFAPIFEGEFFLRLGDQNSPTRAYFSQTGTVVEIKEGESYNLWVVPALNVQGKDKIVASYVEPLTADGRKNVAMEKPLRLAADALVEVLNLKGNAIELLKPGMSFDLQVTDPNGDLTPKRDTIKATLTSSVGDKLEFDLSETDIHSGIFSAIVSTAYGIKGEANTKLEVTFDGTLTATYRDEDTVVGTAADRAAQVTTRPLGEAEGSLLTKIYDDPKFEVETLVRLGESLYAVGAAELATKKFAAGEKRTNTTLEESARLMGQVIQRFPTSEYVVESLYLTGKIRREEQKFEEAEKLFTRVLEDYPDSDFVPQALYQLVLLHYDRDDIDKSTESAMRLVYGYPKNPLVADAFLRIAEYYYAKSKAYMTAAYIYKRVIERFPDNPRVELIKFRMATAYYRAGLANDPAALSLAIRYYMEFVAVHDDSELADDSMYWAANAYMKQNNIQRAYTLLVKQLIDYPTGDMKDYAVRLRDKIKETNPNIEPEQGFKY